MARIDRTDPRKRPRQRRSETTVASILEATARLFGTRGYRGTTTNRIAELAGVSVGSLYQYFPSKEALMAALVERHLAETLETIEPLLALRGNRLFSGTARAIVAAVLGAHVRNPALLRVLHAELPRTGRLGQVHEAEARLPARVRALLDTHRGELHVRDPAMTAFVLVHLVEGLAHAALAHRPDLLPSRGFRDAIVDAVLGCVGAPPDRADRRWPGAVSRPPGRGRPRGAELPQGKGRGR